MTRTVTIYTDGSCINNGKPNAKGGWAAVLSNGKTQRQLSGYAEGTTSQRMELTAVIESLRAIKKPEAVISLYTDSKYVCNGCDQWLENWKSNGWRSANRKPVKNQELWQTLDAQLQRLPNLSLRWVKGHSGDPMNDLADSLAAKASHGVCVDRRLAQ